MIDIVLIMIPVFPLLGFLILGLGYRSISKKWATVIGPGMVLFSFILAVVVLLSFHDLTTSQPHHLFKWIHLDDLIIPFAFLIDQLAILMLLIVTGVGFIIHVYSIGYMEHDAGFNRFFAYMNLFVFFMLLLVMGGNYVIMFIGWEGVGLCSYLLIGFWNTNHDYNNAAKKAFIMNRIGDLAFLLGIFLIFTTFHSLNYLEVFAVAKSWAANSPVIVTITLLLFVGAVGKSAQIPLFTWLPDAMAGPTPVSALIHAATMVTAGVYMVARSNILYVLSPFTMSIIGIIGLATALFAASIAIFQNDIKKILAYSTISQLGYMFLGLSVGAFTGAMFHLTTHAFFKALLFLGAGSVIHTLGGEQDIRNMGGLKNTLPITYWTFLIGTIAIAGIPPLSGFFSKDEILLQSFESNIFLWIFAIIGSMMTAFYMFRLLYLTFFRNYRGAATPLNHIHESPGIMTYPLIALAVLAVFGGLLNLPDLFGGNAALEHFLAPVFADSRHIQTHGNPAGHFTVYLLMGITLIAVLSMIYLAYKHYVKSNHILPPAGEKHSILVQLISGKFYIDELYDAVFVKPILRISRFLYTVVEKYFIDGMITGIGWCVSRTGQVLRYLQTGNAGFYMFMMVLGIILLLFLNILL